MLDHVFLSVSDIERSIAFYAQALAPLGIADRVDYDGKDGPPGHPDLKGFGCKGRIFFWLRLGVCPSIRFDRFRREFDFAKSAI
jgi:catechol 2,3-dioxygenase-like lactoylglutathione lyase family enzyme